ncbi:MAG TPA: dethiobiotin synthase [Planctomycetota bacterium]|nr:dethiobiotin synthase [Planctomycetota bacterium]
MPTTQGLFVTGTDTDVGKTLVSAAIVRILREQGVDAVGFKPVATGEVGGSWGDAVALHEASGKVEPIERICPLRFALPLAPTLAAAREGIEPDTNLARNIVVDLCERHSAVIVEGVGGILCPIDSNTLVVDFAAQIGFPVLVVCTAQLGTINHTLLTIREIERCRLRVAGVIMNITRASDAHLAEGSKAEIERISGCKVLATLPHFTTDDDPDAPRSALVARAIASLIRQVEVKSLLGSEGSAKSKSSGRFKRRRATD